jgi:ATP-dependent Clp protease ATP-binding subunit ClpC
MSEYQQESDVSRLLSSGQNESTSLAMKVRQRPFSVVLLDEIEKANPNILNLLLQMLDEGQLTDDKGRKVSFKDSIVICTSNAGADTIRQKIEQGEKLEDFAAEFSDQLINSGQFKPELINRFDEIVLFRQLMPDELKQVVQLQMKAVNQSLASQNITVELTDAAADQLVAQGNDPRLGARPMRRAVQKHVQDVVAEKILKGQAKPGDKITLDTNDLKL